MSDEVSGPPPARTPPGPGAAGRQQPRPGRRCRPRGRQRHDRDHPGGRPGRRGHRAAQGPGPEPHHHRVGHPGQPGRHHHAGHPAGPGGRGADHRVQRHHGAARVVNVLLQPGRGHLGRLGFDSRRLLGPVRGRDLQPAHDRGRVPRRLGRRHLLPAVADRVPGHPADPDRAVGGAGVPGRPVQHRRGQPVDRRRHRGHLPRLRGQPAAGHPRHRLPDRRLRGRRGAGLAGR